MNENFTLEAETKCYFGCEVTAYRTIFSSKYHAGIPWLFAVKHHGKRLFYTGLPNYCISKASALKRGWFRAKWLVDGTYQQRCQKQGNLFE